MSMRIKAAFIIMAIITVFTAASFISNLSFTRRNIPDAATLSKVSAACEKYDIDELDEAMMNLEAYEYEIDDELVVWLRENVDRMNYNEIIYKLSSLIDQSEV